MLYPWAPTLLKQSISTIQACPLGHPAAGELSALGEKIVSEAEGGINPVNKLNQSAFHGSTALHTKFLSKYIGSGEGNQVHGWGFYFAQAKKVAEGYQAKLLRRGKTENGRVFEVDISENDVLLDEQLSLKDQPLAVREAIMKYYLSRPDNYAAPNSLDEIGGGTGRDFYQDVVCQMRQEGHEDAARTASD